MNAPVTRRGLVQAAGAALGATVAGIPAAALASPISGPDAAFVILIARHAEVLAELKELDDAADSLRKRFRVTVPERPDALRWRPGDFARTSYGRGLSEDDPDTGERWYGVRGVEWLRKARLVAQWTAEAEARQRAIVRGWDDWMAARHALADRIGLTEANEACDRASDFVEAVEMSILDYVPATLPGFRAKARWIASTKQADEWAVVLLRDFGEVAS